MSTDLHQALQLRDIHLPPAPPLWPPAPGWWIVAAILLALAAWGSLAAWRRLRLRRERRRVMDMLARLESGLVSERSPEALTHISVLLRRLALMRFPRANVAALTGPAWLRFLDESGGQGRFAEGPGRVLGSGPYRRALPTDMDVVGLMALVREWVGHQSRRTA
ncbi:MAG: DUF4381 domain-containing protein [Pseudomonadota bacterium]|nr:DUF4381 domain-containing protein [Pseudomonadota bacterium]